MQFYFWKDVFFTDYSASNSVSAETEGAAWLVHFSENLSHSVTFKVLSKESLKFLHHSSLWHSSSGRNGEFDGRASQALGFRGLGLDGVLLPPGVEKFY